MAITAGEKDFVATQPPILPIFVRVEFGNLVETKKKKEKEMDKREKEKGEEPEKRSASRYRRV